MTDQKVARVIEVVAAAAVVASAALVAFGPVPSGEQWVAAAFFAGFGLLASMLAYKTSSETTGTIGFLPFLSVATISPNSAALVAVLVGILCSELMSRKPLYKLIFNVSQQALAESLAIATYLALGGTSILERRPSLHAFVAMVAVFMIVNKLAVSTIVSVANRTRMWEHWLKSMRGSITYDLLAFPLIFFFALVYSQTGPTWSAAFALPLLGVRQLYKQNFALQKINEELLQLMVAAIEARDPYTSGHSQRVARYARVIARSAGLGARATERVAVAALLHDVGKIHEEFAPILRKPGRLSDDEFEIMKSHSARSSALVGKVSHFADLVPLVHAHHEAWDGQGYPLGLVGDAIPVGARVIALADTIDAMSTSRPYRPALPPEDVRAELTRESGRQFDPKICAKLLDDAAWNEIECEIALAVSEYPVSPEISLLLGSAGDHRAVRSVRS
jgi:HD-GYP domain-containing protein (c-di-GMP phosphodiesterase class II)